MPYSISKLSIENLTKIFLILKDIKDRSEIENKTEVLSFGHVNGLKGVPRKDHKAIMSNLIEDGFLKISFHLNSGECVVDIQKDFIRLYNRIKKKMEHTEKEREQKRKPHFDETKSLLYLLGQEIKIARRKDEKTIAHEVLFYIFSNDINDVSFYSEISNQGDVTKKDYSSNVHIWRKYYTACKDIQEKVRKGTKQKIDDFLIFNSGKTGKVKINPKYLS